ncbi:MAG: hypothetical protein ACYC6Y_19760, partial [Thermoguttaceae bacterium]
AALPFFPKIVKCSKKIRDQREQAISVRAVARSGRRPCRPCLENRGLEATIVSSRVMYRLTVDTLSSTLEPQR